MKHIVILLLLSQFTIAFAQDYLPIRQGRTYFFGNQNKVIRIDSVDSSGGNGVEKYFPIHLGNVCKQVENKYLPEFRPIRDSVYVHDSLNESFEIIVGQKKKFLLPYSLELGDSTKCFKDLLQNIELTWNVTSIQEEMFNGYLDTVKTMELWVLDNSRNQLLSHPSFGLTIRVGQTLGVLDWPDWNSLITDGKVSPLVGIPELHLGEYGLSDHEIYDLYPGDNMEFRNITIENAYSSKLYERIRIVSRDTIDQEIIIIKKVEISSTIRQYPYPSNRQTYSRFDTVILDLHPHLLIAWQVDMMGDHGPQVPIFLREEDLPGVPLLSYELLSNSWGTKDSSCYGLDSYAFLKCFKGLGCHVYGYSVYGGTTVGIRYYHKVDSTWGTPLPDSIFSNTVSVSDPLSQEPIRVFPNPGTSIITLSGVADQAMIEVFDLTGKLVWRGTNQSQGIDLSALSAGMYYIRLPEMNLSLKWRKE